MRYGAIINRNTNANKMGLVNLMTYFLRNGTSFRLSDEANMDLHTTLPVGNYIIKQDQFGNMFLEKIDSFAAPKKIYGDILKNAERILRTYKLRDASTGVMLAGEKGSGKTLLSKQICIDAAMHEYPTIVINSPWKGDSFNQLLQSIEQPCVVLFDEFEKVYDRDDQESILTLLDGVFPSKKLFILTCNDKWRIDAHMRNRPGRIFYMLDFKGLESAFIEEYCEDNLADRQHIKTICKIANMFGEFNFDMLKALVEEMNRYNESPQQAMKMLNAKPEFSSSSLTYNVEVVVNNKVVSLEDATWSGNPFQSEITSSYKDVEEDGDWSWVEVTVEPNDLKEVDKTGNKFVFANKTCKVTLTRQFAHELNIWNAF